MTKKTEQYIIYLLYFLDDVSWKWSNTNQRLHTNNTDDVSMIRNLKVIAIHDFVAGKGDQISFKKGMVVVHMQSL